MNNDLKNTNDSIKDYEERITKEKEKLREAQEGKQEKLLEQIQAKEDEIRSKKDRMEELQGQIRTHLQSAQAKRDELGNLQTEDKRLQNEIMQCDAAIQHWTDAATGDLNKYGKNMRSLLQEIERQQWSGRRPVGPFGRHIKVKDRRWISLLQAQIGRHMYSFVVENSADKFKLLNMLKQSNKLVVPFSNHDQSAHFCLAGA
jgi:chromosome segregation ATPase